MADELNTEESEKLEPNVQRLTLNDDDLEEFDDSDSYEDISDDALSDILGEGDSSKKKLLLVGTAGIAMVAVIWLFAGGGLDKLKGDGEAALDTMAVEDEMSEIVEIDTSDETVSEMDDDLKSDEPGEEKNEIQKRDELAKAAAEEIAKTRAEARKPKKFVDTVAEPLESSIIDNIPGETFDDFYLLLNAEVGDDEMQPFDDKALEVMLFQPMEQSRLPGVPYRAGQPLKEWLEELKKADFVDTIETVEAVDDTSKFISMIDSLQAILISKEYEKYELTTENQSLQDQLKIRRAEMDSARAVDLKKLAKIVQSMRPVEAAAMLKTRDSEEVIELLFKLKPRNAAQLLEQLPRELGEEVAARIIKQ